jgi:hypothetical protein
VRSRRTSSHPAVVMATLRWALAGIGLGAALGLASCGSHDDGEHGHAGSTIGPPTKAVCPTPQTLTAANFGESFIKTYCLRCHGSSVQGADRNGAPSDHNFDLALDVRAFAEHIDQYAGAGPAATNTAMPKSDPKPTLQERQKLSEWLACGAS